MNIKKVVLSLAIMITPLSVSAVTTGSHSISKIQYDGATETLYIRTENEAWNAEGCESAKYVMVKNNISGQSQVLSMSLSAKMASRQVEFLGKCASDPKYFEATYIIVN